MDLSGGNHCHNPRTAIHPTPEEGDGSGRKTNWITIYRLAQIQLAVNLQPVNRFDLRLRARPLTHGPSTNWTHLVLTSSQNKRRAEGERNKNELQ